MKIIDLLDWFTSCQLFFSATSHQEDDQSETDSNIPADRKPKKTSILDKISAQTIKQILELLCDESVNISLLFVYRLTCATM